MQQHAIHSTEYNRETHSASKNAAREKRGIIFSDIDGTFVNAEYRCPFSTEFLQEVFTRYDVIFTSSRTIEEILLLQQTLLYRAPFIAENGGVIVFYDESHAKTSSGHSITLLGESVYIVPLGFHALDILPFVKSASATSGVYAENIAKMPLETIAELSQYSAHDAYYAQKRRYSLALSTIGQEQHNLQKLSAALEKLECSVSSGGKWLNVTRGSDKGLAVHWYRGFLRFHGISYNIVAGIGNESNDAAMLNAVDMPFVIRNPTGYAEALENLPGGYFLQSEGVMGWIEMINYLDSSFSPDYHLTNTHLPII